MIPSFALLDPRYLPESLREPVHNKLMPGRPLSEVTYDCWMSVKHEAIKILNSMDVSVADSTECWAVDIFAVEAAIYRNTSLPDISSVLNHLASGIYNLNHTAIPSPCLRSMNTRFYDQSIDEAVFDILKKWMEKDMLFSQQFSRLIPFDADNKLIKQSSKAIEIMLVNNQEAIKEITLNNEIKFLFSILIRDRDFMRLALRGEKSNLPIIEEGFEDSCRTLNRLMSVLNTSGSAITQITTANIMTCGRKQKIKRADDEIKVIAEKIITMIDEIEAQIP